MTWPERLDREPTRRLMRRWLRGVQRGKPVLTAITDPDADRPAGLVNRQFRANAPNRLWDADITVVQTWQGFCYTACCGAGPRCRDQVTK